VFIHDIDDVVGAHDAIEGAHAGAPRHDDDIEYDDAGADQRVRPNDAGADQRVRPDAPATRPALGPIVQWFKTMTTNDYIRGVKADGWPRFARRLWQRNYYERIVRDDAALEHIRQYIAENSRRQQLVCRSAK
jgi:hypothetical protein